MPPSLLDKDTQEGLRLFLNLGFEASDDFMGGIMARFVVPATKVLLTGHQAVAMAVWLLAPGEPWRERFSPASL